MLLILPSLLVEAGESLAAKFAQDAEAEFMKPSKYQCIKGFPCFEISLDYPNQYDSSVTLPWENIDFKSDPKGYMESVKKYAIEGNVEVDWNIKKNTVRKWFHAPWMHQDANGREPIRGLTRERYSRWHELSSKQTRKTNNWAVGFYNDRGGYEFGRVWSNKAMPDTSNVEFPLGTVSVKLLFTDAKEKEAPYLYGTGEGLSWDAEIHHKDELIVSLRLLQLDIAVRDKNANSTTGWVFGTFMFNASKGSSKYWDNLVPVGLQWGNDPTLTMRQYDSGKRPVEGWVNPPVAQMFKSHRLPFGDLGYLGRVNGPIDNPFSSCLSCHSRAVDTARGSGPAFVPELVDMCVEILDMGDNKKYKKISDCTISSEAKKRNDKFFRNLKTGQPFLKGDRSLDYSLQMAKGIANWRDWVGNKHPNRKDALSKLAPPPERDESLRTNTFYSPIETQISTLSLDKAFLRGDEDL